MTVKEIKELIKFGSGNAYEELHELYKEATKRSAQICPSDRLGEIRQKIELSSDYLKAIFGETSKEPKIEQLLQRTLLAVMPNFKGHCEWFNEFNVANNRGAVDLGRLMSVTPNYSQRHREVVHSLHDLPRLMSPPRSLWLDFFELKEWESNDKPDQAARQVCWYAFRYCGSYFRYSVSGGALKQIRLAVMAPYEYFEHHGYEQSESFAEFRHALNRLQQEYEELKRFSFHESPVILPDTTKQDFLRLFNKTDVQLYISDCTTSTSACTVLSDSNQSCLRTWLKTALRAANLTDPA